MSVADPNPHGSLVTWIRIRIRIRIKYNPDPQQIKIDLQMTSQNLLNIRLFEHFFKGLSFYLEAGKKQWYGYAVCWVK